MKSPFVGGLAPNEVTTIQFIVTNKEIRQKKTGEPYLSLQLADRTGEIEAKMWDNVTEVMDTFDRDDFVKVKGLMQVYQKRTQFTIHRLRRLEDHEVDFADYFPCSSRDPQEMFRELEETIANIGNLHLRALLQAVFGDNEIAEKFRAAPAAKSIHHACRGGLLEHVLSLCTLGKLTAAHYKNIDLDLLITGVLLHDIGKIEELSYDRSFGYSSEGQLLGHIVIGLRIFGDKVRSTPDFPRKLRTLVEHMIISHHGELEFGSPKVPIFAEAMLLHQLDSLDSKMEAIRSNLAKDLLSESEFTGWVPSLERQLLRKERYLNGVPARAESRAPEPAESPSPAEIEFSAQSSSVAPAAPPTIPTREVPPLFAPEINAESRHAAPGLPVATQQPERAPGPPKENANRKPAPATLFGEKLQAVLGPRK